jgi:hypothetical protein
MQFLHCTMDKVLRPYTVSESGRIQRQSSAVYGGRVRPCTAAEYGRVLRQTSGIYGSKLPPCRLKSAAGTAESPEPPSRGFRTYTAGSSVLCRILHRADACSGGIPFVLRLGRKFPVAAGIPRCGPVRSNGKLRIIRGKI